ncbi:SDR family oxidoreductase [Flammeovirga sp. MY04]|uniref:SDR family oxidoreductase n=1 Tax=Flammeovirga sp. MY04 TaxID=1191459 RepID=UPI0008063C4A|nr:SDR family oxidoreductase [Flammeovirga sp. MY04]ANQ49247.1 SDR family oxidoreductase [Flammeovirga sp. MY04]
MIWSNKKIAITGGTSGIGKATLELCLKLGADVVFCGKEDELVSLVNNQTKAKGICVDLSKQEGIEQFYDFVTSELGEIDILINNAGYVVVAPLEELKREDFELMYAINVIAPALLTQKFLPSFKSKKEGDIVNIGATGGSYGFEKGAAYASSKAALLNFSQTLMKEVRQDNIRVYHIDPSWTTGTNNNNKGGEIPLDQSRLTASDIAKVIINQLELPRRAFIPQVSIWSTNP